MTLSHASRYPALLLTDVWQWWVLPPGLAITMCCLALAFLGLGLERVTNPRLREAGARAGTHKSIENPTPAGGTMEGWRGYAGNRHLEGKGPSPAGPCGV